MRFLPAVGIAVALACLQGADEARAWPSKAEMSAFVEPFLGRTYILHGGGLASSVVYFDRDGRSYGVGNVQTKLWRGSWSTDYSPSRKLPGLCFSGGPRKQCFSARAMKSAPSRSGDPFGLKKGGRLSRELPFGFGLKDAEAILADRSSKER